jgi:hypothetical protein
MRNQKFRPSGDEFHRGDLGGDHYSLTIGYAFNVSDNSATFNVSVGHGSDQSRYEDDSDFDDASPPSGNWYSFSGVAKEAYPSKVQHQLDLKIECATYSNF